MDAGVTGHFDLGGGGGDSRAEHHGDEQSHNSNALHFHFSFCSLKICRTIREAGLTTREALSRFAMSAF
jgi:hypothetical protein